MLLEPSYDKQTAEEFHASDWENFLGDTFTPWADDFAGDHSKDCFVDADVTKSSQSLYSCTWLGEEKESRQTIDDQVEEVSFLQASDGLEEKVVLQAVSEATLDPLHQQAFSSPPSSPPFPSARGHDRSLEALPVPNKVDGDQWPLGNAQFMSQMSQMTCSQMAAITSQMNNMAALNQAPSLPVQSAESLPVSPGATHMLPGMFSPMIAGACAAASSLTVPGTPSGLGPSSPPASVIQVPPLPRGLLARRSLMFQGSLEAGAGFTLPLAPPLLVPPPSGLALHPISLLQAQISSIKSVTAAANAQAAASASTSGSSRVNSLPTPRATPRATPRPTPRATPRATPAWSAGLPSPHPEAAGHDQPGHPSPAAASYQDELIFHDEDLQDSAEDAAEDTCQQSTRRRGGGSEKDKEFVQNTAAKAARKRRLGVNSRLKILEDLVPLSGKGDTARMLSEVQDYIAQMLASIGELTSTEGSTLVNGSRDKSSGGWATPSPSPHQGRQDPYSPSYLERRMSMGGLALDPADSAAALQTISELSKAAATHFGGAHPGLGGPLGLMPPPVGLASPAGARGSEGGGGGGGGDGGGRGQPSPSPRAFVPAGSMPSARAVHVAKYRTKKMVTAAKRGKLLSPQMKIVGMGMGMGNGNGAAAAGVKGGAGAARLPSCLEGKPACGEGRAAAQSSSLRGTGVLAGARRSPPSLASRGVRVVVERRAKLVMRVLEKHVGPQEVASLLPPPRLQQPSPQI
eukprot:jgi/Mesen1/9853/ME000070S09137